MPFAVAVALLVAGCGDEDEAATQARVYFLQEGKVWPVSREIDASDEYHRKSMENLFHGHGEGPNDFGRFYDVMLLWDETMAETIADYLKSPVGRGMKMVVFAGGFHVGYGFGIPRRVFRRLPESYAIVLPRTGSGKVLQKKQAARPDLPLYIADFVWATAPGPTYLTIPTSPALAPATARSAAPG